MENDSRLSRIFAGTRARNEAALVAFLVAGDPDRMASLEYLLAVAEGGADVLELGLPFSDPLADGKVIQEGCQRSLASGTTPQQVLELAREVRSRYHSTAIVLFSCYNLLLQYGLHAFAADMAKAGADGVIVTDLPPEEGQAWWAASRQHNLDNIFLVAPTSRPERISQMLELSRGFVYCVSRMGVTGARRDLPVDLPDFVGRIKTMTDLPVAVGFGIATPDQVRQVCAVADGAVVGSALVEKARCGTPQTVCEFVHSLKAATRKM